MRFVPSSSLPSSSSHHAIASLVHLGFVILTDLEVSQLVRLFIRRHDTQPVSQIILLQVFLCEIFQIPEGKDMFTNQFSCKLLD